MNYEEDNSVSISVDRKFGSFGSYFMMIGTSIFDTNKITFLIKS
ncbi:hypothetical protein LINGRAHAP2_LOCUS14998, partial [Linum grandiflorum]